MSATAERIQSKVSTLSRADKVALLTWLEPDWRDHYWDEDIAMDHMAGYDDGQLLRALEELNEADAPCVSPIP